jgi:hypothetical protein
MWMNKAAQQTERKVDHRTLNDDRDWLMAQNLSEFAGQWIAVYKHSIIARGKHLKKVMSIAEESELETHPLYLRIPEGAITR